jgi:RNA polymerase sigma-70 factor, ECF subfamily
VETILELQNGIRQHRFVSTPSVIEISDEATLATAAREGNRVAFGRLYERYSRMVHGILLARVPRPDVDDLVQDVFMIALRQIHTLRNASAFGGWLAMIARHRATDYHRSAPDSTELTEDLQGESATQAEAILILDKIRSLPDAYRETLILRLVEGMTGPEIAERTGLTAASVRVNLHRGMKQLREKLERRNVHE